MTDTAVRLDRPRRGPPLANRAQAFRDAARHTRRVKFLRLAIVLGSIGLVGGVAGWSLFAPTGKLPGGVTINNATLDGTRVMMDLPKLNGFRRDGRPYEVRARTGVQDIRTPKIIELTEIDATLQTSDGASVRVLAPKGVFDSGTDHMRLDAASAEDGIRITSTSGYDAVMRTADMDFKKGGLVSRDPVVLTLTNGSVKADGLEIVGHGQVVTFTGNVKSIIAPDSSVRITRSRGEGNKE
ncbi:MAG: lipopolysaccharide-assembly, LptC-related protein [Beijerinckiaceae bacterium]